MVIQGIKSTGGITSGFHRFRNFWKSQIAQEIFPFSHGVSCTGEDAITAYSVAGAKISSPISPERDERFDFHEINFLAEPLQNLKLAFKFGTLNIISLDTYKSKLARQQNLQKRNRKFSSFGSDRSRTRLSGRSKQRNGTDQNYYLQRCEAKQI